MTSTSKTRLTDRILGVIVARRNSQRLPDKNVEPLHGKPLVVWAIEQALGATSLAHIVLSSDDERVLSLAGEFDGLEVKLRPDHLAHYETPIVDVLRHVIDAGGDGFSHVALLQPTSPLRVSADIDKTVELALRTDAKSCISVCQLGKPPSWLMTDRGEGRLSPAFEHEGEGVPAQIFVPNGAVFVIETQWLMAGNDFYTASPTYYVMPPERSIDIDEQHDIALAEAMGAVLRSS